MRVKILRQDNPGSEPYWESFRYDGSKETSVAGLLDYLNYHDDIVTEDGNVTGRIRWECSCLQAVCGACAMVINGVPALACETFLKDLKGDEVTIEPLRKFPVICDLVSDRSVIQENLKKTNIYIEAWHPSKKEDHVHQYTVAKCLKCGLCLEICPNYGSGESFYGAAFANDCYLINARNRTKSGEMKKVYREHFGNGCSKALSCMDVCPMGIQTIASIAKLQRNKF